MTETRSLHRKLAQIFHEAERIPKRGRAPQAMGGYSFVQVGDAADYIRKALADQVLTMMPTKVTIIGQQDRPTKAGGSMTTLDLLVDWTISDGESGETIVIQSFGAGADGGDKYSGKAMTSAMKYALLSGFLLSTGDDTELGSHEAADRPVPGAPIIASDRRPAAVITETAQASPFQTTETGTVEFAKSGPADGELRSGPSGPYLVFRFVAPDGKVGIPQVAAYGPLAEALSTLRRATDFLDGMSVTISGVIDRVPFPQSNRTFQRMTLARIERNGPDGWTLPAPQAVSEAPEPTETSDPPALAPEDQAELDALWPDVIEKSPA